MPFAHEKLKGLPREQLLEAVEPVLQAHRLEGVELIWRTDNKGRVLYLTVERPGSRTPGAGVTLDDCSELSRDLSAALDVTDVISTAYRLEVGTPGLERTLYSSADYARFSGQSARVKLRAPLEGEWTLRGHLLGLDEQGRIQLDTDRGVIALDFEQIEQGNLVLDFGGPKQRPSGPRRVGARPKDSKAAKNRQRME
jgi:ribosome maturation factor RimP